jgi:plasmid stability protein
MWSITGMPKNITLAIDEDLLDKARVLAAMRRTSVNEMVREYLRKAVDEAQDRDEATEGLLKLATESDANFGSGPFARDEAYSGTERFDRWR